MQLILILLGLAVTLFLVWVLRSQHKVKKAVIGHILATFYTSTGQRYDALCVTDDKLVDAPARAVSASPKVKTYLIQENKCFQSLYPAGKPSWLQTSVPCTAYYEGSPEPIISRAPEDRMVPIGSPAVLHNIRDEKMTGLMVRVGEEMEKLAKAARAIMNAKVIYLLLGLGILIGTINIYLLMATSSQITKLARLWGL